MLGQQMFSISFREAYSFRNLLMILKSEAPQEANLHLTPRSIFISEVNEHDTVKTLFHFSINVNDVEYEYNVRDPKTGEPLDELLIGFNTNDILKAAKAIKKRDALKIFMVYGDIRIHIRPLTANKSGEPQECVKFVNTKDVSQPSFTLPTYSRAIAIKIGTPDFSTVCTQATTSKCAHVEANCYPRGIKFVHYTPQKQVSGHDSFGEITSTAEGVTRIPVNTIKSLSRLSNCAPAGNYVNIFHEPNKPLLISSKVGVYGVLNLYIQNLKNEVVEK